MLVKKNVFLPIVFLAILFQGCQKEPSADFTTDKTEYTAGETVELRDNSIDAKKYKWTLPDGQTANSVNVDYLISPNQPDGTLTFKLETSSSNGKKSDEAVKTVTVKAGSGQGMIWTSNSTVNQITVNIDNVSAGTITQYYTGGAPTCGALGCVTANLEVGSHTVTATDGSVSWTGTLNITNGNCFTLQLQ